MAKDSLTLEELTALQLIKAKVPEASNEFLQRTFSIIRRELKKRKAQNDTN